MVHLKPEQSDDEAVRRKPLLPMVAVSVCAARQQAEDEPALRIGDLTARRWAAGLPLA
jgi:hypothetical protein